MDFETYIENTRKTALYPKEEAIDYVVLGLHGEAGEICNKVKKIIRDNNNELNETVKEKIRHEFGDCCWYLARTWDEITKYDSELFDYSLYSPQYKDRFPLNEYKDDIVPYTYALNLVSADILNLAYHTYHLKHDPQKRIERCGYITFENLCKFRELITIIAAQFLDTTFEELCDLNIEKLFSRLDRGVIKGDGDNR